MIQLGGGTTSHGAILARAFELPAIGGAIQSLEQLQRAQWAAISGADGSFWIDPSPEVLADLTNRQRFERSENQRALQESQQPAVTRDGSLVRVGANAGSAKDISSARTNGAEFIGLFRSEFLFQEFAQEPDEDRQLTSYLEALAPAGDGLPITIRLLDIGGDKPLKFLPQPKEANPFLGVRGIRLLMANQRFFRIHLRAILRLAHSFRIQLLIPMITELSEILAIRKMLGEIDAELTKAKVPHRWPIPVGAMIETPSAGLLIDQFLPHLDFVSIGSNDLTQCSVCRARKLHAGWVLRRPSSRGPANERTGALGSSEKGHQASLCGEVASDLEALPVWLAIGLREMSVTAAAVPGIKAQVRKIDVSMVTAQFAAQRSTSGGASNVRAFSRSLTL